MEGDTTDRACCGENNGGLEAKTKSGGRVRRRRMVACGREWSRYFLTFRFSASPDGQNKCKMSYRHFDDVLFSDSAGGLSRTFHLGRHCLSFISCYFAGSKFPNVEAIYRNIPAAESARFKPRKPDRKKNSIYIAKHLNHSSFVELWMNLPRNLENEDG